LEKEALSTPDLNDYVQRETSMWDIESQSGEEFPIKDFPLSETRRQALDAGFLYLKRLFDFDIITRKPIVLLGSEGFPELIKTSGEIHSVMKRVAAVMDINVNEIELIVTPETQEKEVTGNSSYVAGYYQGKNEKGKYVITILDGGFKDIERIIATLVHEFCHIKLLGEGRMEENSEELTDMLTMFYGFGIYTANTSLKYSQHSKGWNYNFLGYLRQTDWAYLFALYLLTRQETDPDWLLQLNKTITKDIERALEFFQLNPEKVLQNNVNLDNLPVPKFD
jgi:hypothetical protein